MKRIISFSVLLLCMGAVSNAMALSPSEEFYNLKLLGKFVFFDHISKPNNQSCSSCHVPSTGGTGGSSHENLTQVAIDGADPTTIGNLKPPTNMYATLIPPFKQDPSCGGVFRYCGGNFWNGRAIGYGGEVQYNEDTGEQTSTHVIGPLILGAHTEYAIFEIPSADQALNPFPNDVEQNVPVSEAEQDGHGLLGAEAVCDVVKNSQYAFLYEYAWGEPINCSTEDSVIDPSQREVDVSYQRIGVALAAYQDSSEINSFSSKRDYALGAELACADSVTYAKYYDPSVCNQPDYIDTPGKFPLVGFSDQENLGHDLFYGQTSALNPDGKNAQCTECHETNKAVGDGTDLFERYTDDSYHTIGTPPNPEITNPECPAGSTTATCREGLAGHIWEPGFGGPAGMGMRKIPTLRNVDKRPYPGFVKAYGANGWFKSLEGIIHYYNTAWVPTINCVIGTGEDCTGFGEVSAEKFASLTSTELGITRCEERPEGWTEAQALAANCWPAPEFPNFVPFGLFVGDLHLTPAEEAALVAYMKTLTDQVTAIRPTAADLLIARLNQEGERSLKRK
jgi:cytochrome c peroxidase